jgi:hypothetical protein
MENYLAYLLENKASMMEVPRAFQSEKRLERKEQM